MSIAYGKLESSLPGQFAAKFVIDEVGYEYTAGFSPPIKLFGDVTLTYATKDQLMGATAFVGEFEGGAFNLRFSALGVSIFCGPSPPEGAEGGKCVISGLGTWSMSEQVHVGATGTIVATSSTTFVAVFVVKDVRQKYSGTFRPPLSTFSSNLVKLSFDNEGQMIGSPAFTAEVGISSILITLSSPGVTMSGPLKTNTTSKFIISGTGAWNDNSPENTTAYGTVATTSSSTFVASFTVDDVVYRYTAGFHPPISRFTSNEMTLTFQNLGQLIGAPAFTGEVGIDSINLISSQPGLVMHGYLNSNLPSKTTIFGEGTWSTTSIVGGHQDFPVSSGYPRLTNDMISVNVFNASPGSIATKSGNMVRYGFDSEGNLVWAPANFNDQFPDGRNIRNITTRNINLFNSPSANALGGMLGITSPVNSTQPLPTNCSAPGGRPRTPPRVPHDTAPSLPSTDDPDTQTAFYAYAKSCEDNTHGRYIINFATRDVADYWWRAVMDSVANGYPRFSDIQRISPQFYVHKPGNSNISETIKDSSCASHLARDVSFTLLSDGDTRGTHLIPIIHVADCISGGRYFVRSALDPELFWFWDGRVVRASRNRRTKFTIQAADAPQRERMLLVGSDNTIISVDEATPIGSSESQTLVHAPTPLLFKFGEFKNAFTVNQDDMIVRTWNGEDWKLVE